MVLLSNLSAIATLIAFLVLLTGKIILVNSRKNGLINEFSFEYLMPAEWNNVYDEWIIDHENTYNGEMCIRSSMGLKKISVYQINDEHGDPLSTPVLVGKYDCLPANQILKLQIRVPEGYPLYKITAVRNDYVVLEKVLSYNGSGLQKYNHANGKFTLRSYLFYIFS